MTRVEEEFSPVRTFLSSILFQGCVIVFAVVVVVVIVVSRFVFRNALKARKSHHHSYLPIVLTHQKTKNLVAPRRLRGRASKSHDEAGERTQKLNM